MTSLISIALNGETYSSCIPTVFPSAISMGRTYEEFEGIYHIMEIWDYPSAKIKCPVERLTVPAFNIVRYVRTYHYPSALHYG
jgi:hypothetical protein